MPAGRSKVIILGWDAADWQIIMPLLKAGQMPTLQKLVENGVSGNISTLQPPLSPILWNSISTGKCAAKHGILGFTEPRGDGGGIQAVSSTSRKTKALWNIASQNGLKSLVVGWFASHPAEPIDGAILSDIYIANVLRDTPDALPPAGAIHPPSLQERLHPLRVYPSGVGTDLLQKFFPRMASIPESATPLISRTKRLLALCETTQNTFIHLLKDGEWDLACCYSQAIDSFCHKFMPYHPPRMPHVPQREFEWFKDCIHQIYRHHDAMLAETLAAAGADATVLILSDHGFVSDHLRPATLDTDENPTSWHRAHGIFVAHGPGIRKGHRLLGASVIDITPTVLTLMGLPIGTDMDGKVLIDIFDERPELRVLPSWDKVDGPRSAGRHPPDLIVDPFEQADSLQQLVDLGYIADPGIDAKMAIENAKIDAATSLAASEAQRNPAHFQAIAEKLYTEFPEDGRAQSLWLQMLITMRRYDEARAFFGDEGKRLPHLTPTIRLSVQASIAMGQRDFVAAERVLQSLEKLEPHDPFVHIQMGKVHSRRRNWKGVLKAYGRAIALDPSSAEAHRGRGYAFLRQGDYELAAEELLSAIELLHDLPAAHMQLGVALLRLNMLQQAGQSFAVALRIQPGFITAHRLLAVTCHRLGHPEQAALHRHAVERLLHSTAAVLAPT